MEDINNNIDAKTKELVQTDFKKSQNLEKSAKKSSKNKQKSKKLSKSSKYFDFYDDIKSGCQKRVDW